MIDEKSSKQNWVAYFWNWPAEPDWVSIDRFWSIKLLPELKLWKFTIFCRVASSISQQLKIAQRAVFLWPNSRRAKRCRHSQIHAYSPTSTGTTVFQRSLEARDRCVQCPGRLRSFANPAENSHYSNQEVVWSATELERRWDITWHEFSVIVRTVLRLFHFLQW